MAHVPDHEIEWKNETTQSELTTKRVFSFIYPVVPCVDDMLQTILTQLCTTVRSSAAPGSIFPDGNGPLPFTLYIYLLWMIAGEPTVSVWFHNKFMDILQRLSKADANCWCFTTSFHQHVFLVLLCRTIIEFQQLRGIVKKCVRIQGTSRKLHALVPKHKPSVIKTLAA